MIFFITLFLFISSLQANIEDSINRAIQFNLSGQPLEAKEIMHNLLSENITEDERACILYNLATIAIQEKNFDEAILHLQQIFPDVNNKPFFTYSVMQNFAIALIEQAERDITLSSQANQSLSMNAQISQTINEAKQKLAIAQQAALKLHDTSRSNVLRLLLLKANAIEILYTDEIKRQRSHVISQPAFITFLDALLPFERELFTLVKNKNNDTKILYCEQQSLITLISFFFAEIFQNDIPDAFRRAGKRIATCTNITELLQEVLFLEFLIKIQDSQIAAIQGLYESDLLQGELRKAQVQMRKEYILSMRSEYKNAYLTKSLQEKVDDLQPQELLIYASALEKQTTQIFIELLEKHLDNRYIEEALIDRLSSEDTSRARKALQILGSSHFGENKLYRAFTAYNLSEAVHYEVTQIMQEGIESKTIPFLIESMQTEPSNDIIKSWVTLLSQKSDLKSLLFLVNLNWLQSYAEGSNISLKQLIQCAQEDVSFMKQIATSPQVSYKTIVTLVEKSMKQGLEHYSNRDTEFKEALQPLIEQYTEILGKETSFELKTHLNLAEKTADLLKKIEEAKKREQQNMNSSATTQQGKTDPVTAIEMFQEMYQQDMPFAQKEAMQLKKKVTRPW